SILPPRRLFAPCSPITQASASTTLDLPEPFGPTTQVIPGSKRSVVAEAKDLKPRSVRFFRYTPGPLHSVDLPGRPPDRSVKGATAGGSRWPHRVRESALRARIVRKVPGYTDGEQGRGHRGSELHRARSGTAGCSHVPPRGCARGPPGGGGSAAAGVSRELLCADGGGTGVVERSPEVHPRDAGVVLFGRPLPWCVAVPRVARRERDRARSRS